MIERFLAAVGGRAALERLEVRHHRGTIVQDLSWKEPHRKLRWVRHPNFALVVEQSFPILEVTARETRERCRVILLTPASLPEAHCTPHFDEETGLLNHVGHHNDLRGWHKVDGVLLPEKWSCGCTGGRTAYLF